MQDIINIINASALLNFEEPNVVKLDARNPDAIEHLKMLREYLAQFPEYHLSFQYDRGTFSAVIATYKIVKRLELHSDIKEGEKAAITRPNRREH